MLRCWPALYHSLSQDDEIKPFTYKCGSFLSPGTLELWFLFLVAALAYRPPWEALQEAEQSWLSTYSGLTALCENPTSLLLHSSVMVVILSANFYWVPTKCKFQPSTSHTISNHENNSSRYYFTLQDVETEAERGLMMVHNHTAVSTRDQV